MKQKKRQDEAERIAKRLEKRPTNHIGSLLLYIQVDEVLQDKQDQHTCKILQDQRICKITIKADSLQQLDCRVPEKRFVFNPCLRELEGENMKNEKERYEHITSILLYIDLDRVLGEGGQSDYRFAVRAWNLEQFIESQKKVAKRAKKAK